MMRFTEVVYISLCSSFVITSIRFISALALPGPPENLAVVSDSKNIGVQWEEPNQTYGEIKKYIVSWAIFPNMTEMTNVIAGEITMSIIPVQGHIGRMYRVRVQAENDAGIGPYSLAKYLRIECGQNIDIFPLSNVTIMPVGFYSRKNLEPGMLCIWKLKTLARYSLDITLNNVDIDENSYEKGMTNKNCSNSYLQIAEWKICSKNNDSTNYSTDMAELQINLKTGTEPRGTGFSVTVKSVVLLPGPPTNVSIRTSDHAITITWQHPNEDTFPVTAYRVRYAVITTRELYVLTTASSMRMLSINTDRVEGHVLQVNLTALIGTEEGQQSMSIFVRAPCRRRLNLKTGESRNITSPGYPDLYPSSIICTWYITTQPNVVTYITYFDFHLEDTLFCSSDYIIFSFNPLPEPECSPIKIPRSIFTNSENFTLTFVSDNQNRYKGFLIEIAVSHKSTKSPHGVTSTSSIITEITTTTNSGSKLEENDKYNYNMSTAMPTTEPSWTKSSTLYKNMENLLTTDSVMPVSSRITVKQTLADQYKTKESSTLNMHNIITNTPYMMTTEISGSNHSQHTLVTNGSNNGNYLNSTSTKAGSDIILPIVLAILGTALTTILTAFLCSWRHRKQKMKVRVEELCSVPKVEIHDIFRRMSDGNVYHNYPIHWNDADKETHPKSISVQQVIDTKMERNFDLYNRRHQHMPEVPKGKEEKFEQYSKFNSSPMKFYSFPCVKKRKVHQEIQKALTAFGFIEDKKALTETIERKVRHRRTNSA